MAMVLSAPATSLRTSQANPRKRKKRHPTTGAAVDCFRCAAESSLKCDRGRPFCSTCLDAGADCPGYKTQLTWGVGVASRGKLRGLSLPIAGTSRASELDIQPNPKRRRDTNVSMVSVSQSPLEPSALQNVGQQAASVWMENAGPGSFPATTACTTTSNTAWDPILFSAPHEFYHSPYTPTAQPISQNFYLDPVTEPQTYLSSSAGSDVHGNLWPKRSTPQSACLDPSILGTPISNPDRESDAQYFTRTKTAPAQSNVTTSAPTSLAETSHSPATLYTDQRYDGLSILLEAGQSMQMLDAPIFCGTENQLKEEENNEHSIDEALSPISTSPPISLNFPRGVTISIGKTARMQYLISYYAEVISPVIVAFDGASNPFRTQILRLAESSETLQHAISALAASNVRQRRGIGLLSTGKTAPARRSSFAHVHLTGGLNQNMLSAEEQMREEILHKRMAVMLLNRQLGHPTWRKDDSTLATLLILCLFHICDSGIAKFQTQFAGVRKLLAFRGDDVKIGSESSRWMSRLFTWFDSLAATVNDRERQITGQFLDMSALCGDWALERMAGIDGQLFKPISRLGRLNLLQQGRKVEAQAVNMPLSSSSVLADRYASLDGNGWVQKSEDIGLGIKMSLNGREEFWQEWESVRQELLSWRLDTTLFDSLNKDSADLTVEQRIDMENISQSFRYAALLFLERLAYPNLSSGDEKIQHWVQLGLKHIREVISDVYLLWPLFIVGTECIDEAGRNVIRGRCADIQKDSGFVNNASCLQLLEQIWRANSPDSSPVSDETSLADSSTSLEQINGSVFRFRDAMIKEAVRTEGDGEYLVV